MHVQSTADHTAILKSLVVLFLQFSVENQNKSHQNDNQNPHNQDFSVKTAARSLLFFVVASV